MWNKHVEKYLVPIIGHFLYGDSRRRQLMLKYYYSTTGIRCQIPWEGWRLTGLYDIFKVMGLYIQDYIHDGKTLVNPLFSDRRDFIVGE
jgi:hypothetical protein